MIPPRGEKMKDRLIRFMYGRYGVDALGKLIIGASLVLCIANMFLHSFIISILVWILLFYSYFRMFSRNIQKRYAENAKFLGLKSRIMSKFQKHQSYRKQRKTHHIYKCPTCRQKIRIPRGKGRICITCPKCKTQFTKTS